jgi:hypothetical protein
MFGRAMSQIPIPRDAHVFWVGDLCAPWLVLAFLAGRVQRSWAWAVLGGAATDMGCVTGFYSEFLFISRESLGLPGATPWSTVAVTASEGWLVFISPWLGAAVLGGLVYGLLGWWWRTSRSFAAALALGLPFIAEPALWRLENGYYKGPWPIWAIEVTAGIVLVGVMAVRRRRPPRVAALPSN